MKSKHCKQCGNKFTPNSGAEQYCSDVCIFHSSYEKTGDCWEWQKSTDKDGYGVLRCKGRKRIKAHRFAYQMAHADFPLVVRHACDNPSCVNPAHLLCGTHLQNKADSILRGRDSRGVDHYKAVLTESDVTHIRNSDESGAAIARRYGITKENVYAIRKRQTWKHVA